MADAPSLSRRGARIAAIVAVLVIVALAKWFGLFTRIGDPSSLARSLVLLGGWGYLGFVLAYATLQPFGIPGTVFIVAAPLIWPWPTAFALSMAGTMAASNVGFFFARFVARDWVLPRIPERFRSYEDALERRAFTTVFVLRLVFWMPPLLHAFFGVSRIKGSTHFWGSLAGYLLPVFLVSYYGQRLFDLARGVSVESWVLLTVVAIALAALGLFVLWAARMREE